MLKTNLWSTLFAKPGIKGKDGSNIGYYVDDTSFQALEAMDMRPKFQLFCIQGYDLEVTEEAEPPPKPGAMEEGEVSYRDGGEK